MLNLSFLKPQLILIKKYAYQFSKIKIKVERCGVCSYGRDVQYLKYQIWKLNPQIKIQDIKLAQTNGRFEVSMIKQNNQSKIIYNAQTDGRISPFNIAGLLKKISQE